jgi:hypothetical protein
VIVEKETAETVYWLDVLRQSDMIENDDFTVSTGLYNEANELLALFHSILFLDQVNPKILLNSRTLEL